MVFYKFLENKNDWIPQTIYILKLDIELYKVLSSFPRPCVTQKIFILWSRAGQAKIFFEKNF